MPVVLDVLHAAQACLSAYALYLSYISITDSQKYEEKTKKAAQYSGTAEQQLHKTRMTLASGTAAVSLRSPKSPLNLCTPPPTVAADRAPYRFSRTPPDKHHPSAH